MERCFALFSGFKTSVFQRSLKSWRREMLRGRFFVPMNNVAQAASVLHSVHQESSTLTTEEWKTVQQLL